MKFYQIKNNAFLFTRVDFEYIILILSIYTMVIRKYTCYNSIYLLKKILLFLMNNTNVIEVKWCGAG
jgi:hypothetical protein